jgi:hypothetical protein
MHRAKARFGKLPEALYGWRQHPGSSTRTDERYSHVRFMSLKVAALDENFLSDDRRASLIGVGSSLARWREALGDRVRAVHEARRPPARLAPELRPPLVLALMAPPARTRWRGALVAFGLREMRDFIFVA